MKNGDVPQYPSFKEGDIIEIVFEQYGDIKPFVVRKIQSRGQGEYSPNNSLYVGLRPFKEEDKAVKGIRDGEIIYRLKKGTQKNTKVSE